MAIKYIIEIENSDYNWNAKLIQSLKYFHKYNSANKLYEFRKNQELNNPSVIMEPKNNGLIVIDEFGEEIGRELLGLLVEKATGEKGFIKIDEE